MIAKELRGNETSVLSRLKILAQTGLIVEVAPPMHFQFSPKSDELTARVNSLLECYSTHKVKIIEMIYTEKPNGIYDFSNSFSSGSGKSHSTDFFYFSRWRF